MMRRSIILFVLISLFALELYASGGSLYSRFGKGDVYLYNFGREMGLAGGGYSLGSASNISLNNPAGLYKLQLTRFETGFTFDGVNLSGDESIFYSNTAFSGFAFAIPIDKDLGFSAALGMSPVTRVEFEVFEEVTDTPFDPHKISYAGKGGISKVFLSTSFITPIDFVIGASFEYYTGKIDNEASIDFEPGSFYDSKYTTRQGHYGVGLNLGLITPDLSNLLGIESLSNIRLGASYNFIPNLKTDTSFISYSSLGTSELVSDVVETKIPGRLGVGLSFELNKAFLFTLDFVTQAWSKYEFNGEKVKQLCDLNHFNIAFEYKNPDSRDEILWEQLTYRGGLSYEQTQYEINGKGIDQLGIHGGFSYPFTKTSSIDVGLMFGMRGTKESNLLKEYIYQFAVSISFGELWFQRDER